MKISVIIPIKNRAHLLPITLDNVLKQSLAPYEVIVADDGSTDNIGDIEKRYEGRVLFLRSTGSGPGAARNTGLRASTGDVIQFFDSDDLMTNNKLQVQAELLQNKKADFVYGPYVKAMNENGNWKQTDAIMQYYPLPKAKLADIVLQGWAPITQAVLFSRDLVMEAGPWHEDLMPHEDFEYWFRIGKIAKAFYHENESCVIYRQHQKQITDMDVADKARWLDGLNAMRMISEGIDYKPAAGSLHLFKGRYALSKMNYEKKYGTFENSSVSLIDKIDTFYFKVRRKIDHWQTGTHWQKIHGPLSSNKKQFEHYLSLLL